MHKDNVGCVSSGDVRVLFSFQNQLQDRHDQKCNSGVDQTVCQIPYHHGGNYRNNKVNYGLYQEDDDYPYDDQHNKD